MTSNFDTSDRNAQKGGDFVPRLAMINDIAGFGRCSTTVSLPVISVMKVQVCPVPTSVLSNHLGFPLCHFDDYTSHMRDYIKVWGELGLTFDGLYCGFLGNEEQIDIVREFVEMFRPPLFLLDPVMGAHMKDRRCQKAAEIDLIRSAAAGMDGFLHDPGLSAGSFHLFLTGWKFQDYRPGDLIF